MTKNLLNGLLLSPALVAADGLFTESHAQQSDRPDVLFIFIDDMTYNGIRALGNEQVITPNMDRIAASGVSFANTYNMGAWNGAVSEASRTQLLTGMYLWNAYDAREEGFTSVLEQRATWPQVMKSAGYKTFHTGKWHVVGVNPATVFDEVEVVRPGMPADNEKTTKAGYNRPLSRDDNSWQSWDTTQGGFWEGGKHWSEVQADVIINYMQRNKNSKEPLFMTCAFNAPHDPRQSPKEYLDMYPVDDIIVPESFQPLHPFTKEMRCTSSLRDEALGPFPRTEYAVQKHRQEYYAIITHLDEQIGRILETLEQSGRADNTLIIFTADNGLAMGRHGLLGKQNLYEHSVKIPFIVAGCGLPKGESRTQMIYMQDLIPTIYEIAGIEKPASTQFQSFLNIAKDRKAEPTNEHIYCAYLDIQRMVSDGRYKLYMIPEAGKAYLFDLKRDPEELEDLYGNPKYDKIVERLAAEYISQSKRLNDNHDITGFFPKLF